MFSYIENTHILKNLSRQTVYDRMKTFFFTFIKTLEHLFLTFALPAAVMMAAIEARYTIEHSFWFFFIILFIDTGLLMLKERFGAVKTKDIEQFKKALVWYKAYSIVMVLQFLLGIYQVHGMGPMTLYTLSIILFSTRYTLYKRCIYNPRPAPAKKTSNVVPLDSKRNTK